MSRFSIADLEKLSGIKAHTLRIWEKRYDLLKTKRTDTNIRYYDDEDLKYLLNVSLLVKHGKKISKVAKLSRAELAQTVTELETDEGNYEGDVNSFISGMLELDEYKFEKVFSSCVLRLGIEKTMIEVVYPFLDRIGVLWQTGGINPAQEHFISNLIRQKIIVATDGLENRPKPSSSKFLLFLPEGELHEIALLFTNYLIKSRDGQTLYLGQSVPLQDIVATEIFYKPNYLFLSITTSHRAESLVAYLDNLATLFPNTEILVSGLAFKDVPTDQLSGVTVFQKVHDVIFFVENLGE